MKVKFTLLESQVLEHQVHVILWLDGQVLVTSEARGVVGSIISQNWGELSYNLLIKWNFKIEKFNQNSLLTLGLKMDNLDFRMA